MWPFNRKSRRATIVAIGTHLPRQDPDALRSVELYVAYGKNGLGLTMCPEQARFYADQLRNAAEYVEERNKACLSDSMQRMVWRIADIVKDKTKWEPVEPDATDEDVPDQSATPEQGQ